MRLVAERVEPVVAVVMESLKALNCLGLRREGILDFSAWIEKERLNDLKVQGSRDEHRWTQMNADKFGPLSRACASNQTR